MNIERIKTADIELYKHDYTGVIYASYKLKEVNNLLNAIEYFFNNYKTLNNKEYYDFIKIFYNIKLEDADYIEIINQQDNSNFQKVINIKTDLIGTTIHSEGHGRNFDWWTTKYRVIFKVAVEDTFTNNNDIVYTPEEIKKLVSEGKIKLLDWYTEKCDDNLKENFTGYGISKEYKFFVKSEYGTIEEDKEYFDYIVNKIRKALSINQIYRDVRKCMIELVEYANVYRGRIDYQLRKYYPLSEYEISRLIGIEKTLYFYDKYFNKKKNLTSSELGQTYKRTLKNNK